MLYDLNITWTPQTTQADLERTLKFSQSLGYNVIALNHTLAHPIPAQVNNPIPQPGPVHSSFPQGQSSLISSTNNASAVAVSSSSSSLTKLPTTLRRATILISDPATNHRLPTLAAAYDILAVRPTTEKAFLNACTTMSEISMISLDMTTHFPFHFRPKPCMAAVNRGVLFEICYAQLLSQNSSSSSTDAARARALFIGNVMEIFRATRGRGIVLSSEAKGAAGGTGSGGLLRAPADVVNLFAVWGLSNERGLESLTTNPRSVVVNEGLKRRSFRGVVDIIEAEGRTPGREAEVGDGKKGGQKKKGGNGGSQKQQQGGNGKRKHDGTSDHGGGDNKSSHAVTGKRQPKKMKLAQRTADGSTESSK